MKIGDPRLWRYVSSGFVLVFALATAAYAFTLPMGTLQQPGAGAWPVGLAVVMAVAAVVLLVTERDVSDYEPPTRRTWVSVAGFAIMLAFIGIFAIAGLTLASLFLCLVWLRWMAREPWPLTILLSIAFTLGFVLVFSVALRIPFPRDVVLRLVTGGTFG